MKEIPTARGFTIAVDDSDYEELSKHRWFAMRFKNRTNIYAARWLYLDGRRKRVIYMHRLLLGILNEGRKVMADHIDGNGLKNQRSNLRIAGPSGNGANQRLSKNNTSGVKGVLWNKRVKRWQASISFFNRRIYLGTFLCREDAAKAYRDAAVELWGEYANPTGFPMQCTCPQCNDPKNT